MRQTLVGVFERYAAAREAAQRLRESGFGDSVLVTDEVATIETDASNTRVEPREGGGFVTQVRGFFADLFDEADDEVSPYAEALRRGGGLVKVEVTVESEVVADLQAPHGALRWLRDSARHRAFPDASRRECADSRSSVLNAFGNGLKLDRCPVQ